MPSIPTRDFVETLLATVPELKEVYDDHLRSNDELLPHVFLGDVTRFVISQARQTLGVDNDVLRRVLLHMDAGLTAGHKAVRELVGVSFVENLAGEVDTVRALRPWMSQSMVKALHDL